MDSSRRLQELVTRYASYSQTHSGLGNVLGGGVGLLVFVLVALLPPGGLTAGLVLGLSAAWLVGKPVLRRRLYQPLGAASEQWTPAARRQHIWLVICLSALLFLGLVYFALVGHVFSHPREWPYVPFIFAAPLLTWWFLRTASEAVMGFGVFFIDAIACTAHRPFLLGRAIVPAYGITLIGVGWQEHRNFRDLMGQLRGRTVAEA